MCASFGSLVTEAATALFRAGFDEPRRHARRLIAGAFGLSSARLLAAADREVAAPGAERVRALLRRMLDGEPLTRIFEHREFWGLDFALSPDTLDPRPETETLVAAVLARIDDRKAPIKFLDLGTGTGCVLLALLSELPAATGIGIDLAEGAVRTAQSNAAALGLADRARFVVGDWAAPLAGRFAAIVANPPYIPTGMLAGLPRAVKEHDPERALDGGADGLAAYRAIAADLVQRLGPDGIFVTEIGAGQRDAVQAILADHGLAIDAIDCDLAGIPRCIVARQAIGNGQARRKKLLECAAVPSRLRELKSRVPRADAAQA